MSIRFADQRPKNWIAVDHSATETKKVPNIESNSFVINIPRCLKMNYKFTDVSRHPLRVKSDVELFLKTENRNVILNIL